MPERPDAPLGVLASGPSALEGEPSGSDPATSERRSSARIIPLYQLIQHLPLGSGITIMRALRRGVQVECVLRAKEGGRYVLTGRVSGRSVQTTGHRVLGPPLVDEFVALLPWLVPGAAAPRQQRSVPGRF